MSIISTLETEAQSALTSFLGTFITDDVGKAAVDAVQYVEANVDGDSNTKRDAAKEQLLNALSAMGKDVGSFAASTLNFLIETALQAVAAGVVAAVA